MSAYEDLESLYAWVDQIPLSRCKRNFTRDFADGVMIAELCKYLYPKLVDLHNYPPANSHTAKVQNWETLNRKVFSKLNMRVTKDMITQIAAGMPGALESVLLALKKKIDADKNPKPSSPCYSDSGDSRNAEAPVDRHIVEEIKKLKVDVQLKNDTIATLNNKVSHLENLLHMKEKRLKELSANVKRLEARRASPVGSMESFRTVSS